MLNLILFSIDDPIILGPDVKVVCNFPDSSMLKTLIVDVSSFYECNILVERI